MLDVLWYNYFGYAETDNDAVGFYQKNNFSITEFSEIYDGETVIRYKCELTQFQ